MPAISADHVISLLFGDIQASTVEHFSGFIFTGTIQSRLRGGFKLIVQNDGGCIDGWNRGPFFCRQRLKRLFSEGVAEWVDQYGFTGARSLSVRESWLEDALMNLATVSKGTSRSIDLPACLSSNLTLPKSSRLVARITTWPSLFLCSRR